MTERPTAATAMPQQLPPAIPSQQLLQGQAAVYITHNGVTYRLQATKQGKLILTK